MSDKSDPFFEFVLTYYKNDPYVMLDRFADELAEVAEQRSIDWYKTRDNISLDSTIIRGNRVFGFEEGDKGRISVTGFHNTQTTQSGNIVNYPVVRFKNFRKQFSEDVYFAGYKALWDEFKKHQEGNSATKSTCDLEGQKRRVAKIEAENKRIRLGQKQAVLKDWEWMRKSMSKRTTPCPYLSTKGLSHIHNKVELYKGNTSKGVVGEFTAVVALDLEHWCFGGLQRLYKNDKVFRTGMNPNSKAWVSHIPEDGDDIYLSEAFAEAALVYDLTDQCSVAAFYADNIPLVAILLRARFPNSKLIFVADNDQYSDPNKGVESCVKAINSIGDNSWLYVPQFEEEEKVKKYKDLTDYALAYGCAAAKAFITQHIAK